MTKHTLQSVISTVSILTSGLLLGACNSSVPSVVPTTVSPATAQWASAKSHYVLSRDELQNGTNVELPNVNSQVVATSIAGWKTLLTDHLNFDSAVSTISFPMSLGAVVQTVISDDVALESIMQTMQINRYNVSVYDQLLPTFAASEAQFEAAESALYTQLMSKKF